MRARNIKPGFLKNERLVELPFEWRLLFIGLWMMADREGRLEDRPKRIKMEVMPADDVDIEAGLTALQSAGFIHRYEVDGGRYIEVENFVKHQRPHPNEAKSVIPNRDITRQVLEVPGNYTSESVNSTANCALPSFTSHSLNPSSERVTQTTEPKTVTTASASSPPFEFDPLVANQEAKRVVEHYVKATGCTHSTHRANGAITRLMETRGVTRATLEACADHYASEAKAKGTAERFLLGAANFYAEDGLWERHQHSPAPPEEDEVAKTKRRIKAMRGDETPTPASYSFVQVHKELLKRDKELRDAAASR